MITCPIWPEFVLPILQLLSDGKARTNREIRTAAFDLMGLSDEARAEMLPSGEARAHNRSGWAITYIHKAGWIERVSRGTYRIAEAGRAALQTYAQGFHDYATASAVLDQFWESRPRPKAKASEQEALPEVPAQIDPIEQIENGIAQIDAEVGASLLERLRTSDPAFFEEAVVQVLLAMGYGGSEQRGKRIGGTGDGGVDGVIDQDALGLDQIYVQAKRYAEGNNVGRETIQAFMGALAGVGASRGVFITSSDFTQRALDYANSVNARLILINGKRLVALMLKHRVGVQVKQTYHVLEIDEDFFE